jgi:hypothetical protein
MKKKEKLHVLRRNTMDYSFPFGQKLKRLGQQDKTPKEIFVLGVYASAVHAKWVCNKTIMCQALAVASEPYIFWDGNIEEAQQIISKIEIPSEIGTLVPANRNLNGPSAKVLDENILKPFGISRNQAWLCDLLPESRINPNQYKVIREKYNPLIEQHGLSEVTVPLRKGKICNEDRRREVTKEIKKSKARKLVLLGDIPIQQYLKYVVNIDFSSLSEYTNKWGYGTPRPTVIDNDFEIEVIPIAHPRQIGKLGRSNSCWADEHKKWKPKI